MCAHGVLNDTDTNASFGTESQSFLRRRSDSTDLVGLNSNYLSLHVSLCEYWVAANAVREETMTKQTQVVSQDQRNPYRGRRGWRGSSGTFGEFGRNRHLLTSGAGSVRSSRPVKPNAPPKTARRRGPVDIWTTLAPSPASAEPINTEASCEGIDSGWNSRTGVEAISSRRRRYSSCETMGPWRGQRR
jgi:hypothetical protein